MGFASALPNLQQNYCPRLGAACDFRILELPSDALVTWLVEGRSPFDSLYFYGAERPIHISYGPQHKRDIWTFTVGAIAPLFSSPERTSSIQPSIIEH